MTVMLRGEHPKHFSIKGDADRWHIVRATLPPQYQEQEYSYPRIKLSNALLPQTLLTRFLPLQPRHPSQPSILQIKLKPIHTPPRLHYPLDLASRSGLGEQRALLSSQNPALHSLDPSLPCGGLRMLRPPLSDGLQSVRQNFRNLS